MELNADFRTINGSFIFPGNRNYRTKLSFNTHMEIGLIVPARKEEYEESFRYFPLNSPYFWIEFIIYDFPQKLKSEFKFQMWNGSNLLGEAVSIFGIL